MIDTARASRGVPSVRPASGRSRRPGNGGAAAAWLALVCLGCVAALASAALAEEAATAAAQRQGTAGPAGEGRRVTEVREPLSEEEIAEHLALGKLSQLDWEAGEKVIRHLTDSLPADWGQAREPWERVDSSGEAIVNEVPGWPGWTERNVAALRDEICRQVARREATPPGLRVEVDQTLGNFLAQAMIRDIAVDDLVDLEQVSKSSPAIARAVTEQLHFYENVRAMRLADEGEAYTRTDYPRRVVRLVESLGASMDEVQALEATDKVLTDNCYNRGTFARGMTYLSGSTTLWMISGDDDASADVPIFPFYFNACEDYDRNTFVRVSTNGYLTFVQQGGGALDGTDFSNDPIPSGVEPDGFVAPAWDDYFIATNQGQPDRVSYLLEGSAGQRVFTVEWYSVSRNFGSVDDYHSFQVKLVEATGNVELHLATGWVEDVGLDSATIGVESFDGTTGGCGPSCGNTIVNADITANYRFVPWRPANDTPNPQYCLSSDADDGDVLGDNLNATGTDITSCGVNDFKDVWYEYYAPVNQSVTFDTCFAGTFDTTLAVFNGAGTVELACNDDSTDCVPRSKVTVALSAGYTYRVRVAGYNANQGFFQLATTPNVGGNFDDCTAPFNLGRTFTGDTWGNSGCVDNTSVGYWDVVDEWFAWTPTESGRAEVSTVYPFTDFDTTLGVFASCGGGAELACNDDWGGTTRSKVVFPVSASTTYHLRVAGFDGARGSYQLTAEVCLFCDELESGDTSAWSATQP